MSALTHGNERVVPSWRLKLCGTEEIDPPSQKLAAGPLTAELENVNCVISPSTASRSFAA